MPPDPLVAMVVTVVATNNLNPKSLLDPLAHLAHPDLLDLKVNLVPLATPVLTVVPDLKDLLVLTVLLVVVVLLVNVDPTADLVLLEPLVPLVLRELLVSMEPQA